MKHAPHVILILGASTRAGAYSAVRAGFSPVRGDYFADIDLGPATRIDRDDPDRSFLELAESHPGIPWFYTGGFENRPELVARISRERPLWGACASTLKRVRDPLLVAKAFEDAGIPHPRVRATSRGLPRDGSWLVKPLDSAGGRDIAPLVDDRDLPDHPCYYQERIAGRCFGALYLGAGSRSILVGASRQWTGIPDCRFGYRGSLGPIPLSPRLTDRLTALGEVVAREFAIPGWFGVDYILARGVPWPLEINPRYTASIEIHERATGLPLLPFHRRACEQGLLPEPGRFPVDCTSLVVAKRIVYASRRVVAPVIDREEYQPREPGRPALVADVPAAGTILERGDPVLTVLAWDRTPPACRARVIELEKAWLRRLVRA